MDFGREIQPIFETVCLRCHGVERPKSDFRLTSREAALKGGEHGIAIIPGDSAKSPLIHYVAGAVEDMRMPPEGKGDALTAEQIGILRAWIDQGAAWTAPAREERVRFTASPSVRWVTVRGNPSQFREHTWMNDGWSGGLEEFSVQQRLDERTTIEAEARALVGVEDYRMTLGLRRQDLGFADFGFEQYRKWSSDTGGAFSGFQPSVFSAAQDWHLDVGRSWVEGGLTLPHWPKMTLGYEHQYRDGDRSTLQWGDGVDASGASKKVYPSAKALDEQTHILKFDLSHDIAGVGIYNQFRGEWYDLRTERQHPLTYTLTTGTLDKASAAREDYQHFRAAESVHLEKQVQRWLFLSGGYLFSTLDGDAAFQQSTLVSTPVFEAFDDRFWSAQRILLSQRSHVFNLNTMLGPWDGLSVYAGVQNEWMSQNSLGNTMQDLRFLLDVPAQLSGEIERATVEERLGLRYTKIPFTVVYAEGRLEQERLDHFESEEGVLRAFKRDTDAASELQEYKAGFTVSPWPIVSFNAQVRHREKESRYHHLTDEAFGAPNDGYSAFIRGRNLETEDAEVKMTMRPWRWIKASVSYQIIATDYFTETDSYLAAAGPVPRGGLLAGNYDAHVYALNLTLTPWARWILSAAAAYRDTRLGTAPHHNPTVVEYAGNVSSVWGDATFLMNEKTDLHLGYDFSTADYAQDNAAFGLPLGIEYTRHGVRAGIARHWRKNVTSRLEYAFFEYSEPSRSGFADYTAHGVLATVAMSIP